MNVKAKKRVTPSGVTLFFILLLVSLDNLDKYYIFLTNKKTVIRRFFSSPSWTRTNDPAVNSRMLYRLSY